MKATFITGAVALFAFSAAASERAQLPFWKAKASVYKRVREERAIPVSVREQALKAPQMKSRQLLMAGGAWVKAPRAVTVAVLKDYPNYKELSDIVKEAKFNSERQVLFLHCEAFNYHARMWVRVDWEDESNASVMRFHIIDGTFHGMKGALKAETVAGDKAEMSIDAAYDFDQLPVPQFFVTFGLEVVLQKLAARVRSAAEEKNARPERLGGKGV